MAAEWPRISLREAGVSLIDCDHRTPPSSDIGYPYIAIPQIKRGRLDLSDVRRISHEQFMEWTRKAVPTSYDVVLSRRCNPGETAFVPPGLKCALGQNLVLLRADGKRVFPPFLRWMVRSPDWWEQVGKYINVGAVFDSLKCADIPKFELPLPSLAEQRAIACILETLDDKIELNRQMNETLEAIARAIFKSWFVDFDPVRAKGEGRASCLPKRIADLFPDRFDDSELGEIPAGWRISRLGREAVTVLGGTPSRAEPAYWRGDIPWINSGKANEFRVVEPSEFITQEGLDTSATKMLPSRTTVIAITGATLGQVSLTEIETCANQSIVGVIGTDALPSEFIYFWVKEHIEDLLAWQTGGAQQHINKNNVNDMPVICPNEGVIAAYLALVRSGFDRIKACCNDSLALSTLRDTMLPKLISGELGIPSVRTAWQPVPAGVG